jgi:hypothetical protein
MVQGLSFWSQTPGQWQPLILPANSLASGPPPTWIWPPETMVLALAALGAAFFGYRSSRANPAFWYAGCMAAVGLVCGGYWCIRVLQG